MPATTNTRHAVSRATGATTFVRPVKGVWTATCLNHSQTASAANRTAAWKMGSTPSLFCAKCKAISAGKAEKLADGLLPVPAALLKTADAPGAPKVAKESGPRPPKKGGNGVITPKAASKPTAKKETPAKPKETASQRAARTKAEGFAKDKAATKAGDAA